VRIVFVTSRFPYPVEKGDKLRAFHQIRVLSQHHEIHLVAVSHHRIAQEHLDAMSVYCKSIRVFRIRNWLVPFQLAVGWLEGMPLQVSYFFDRSIKREVQYHIIHLEPDHVICQLIRASPYVRALPFPKTLDYMDVFSEGMYQLAKKYYPFGFVFRWEAKRLAAFERTIYKDFDKHTIISKQDRDRLRLATHDQIMVIPNGVDDEFARRPNRQKPTHDLVFVGNLGYGPNTSAAQYLVKKLLPALKQRGLKVNLLLAGARPGRKIRQLKNHEGVSISGWVEDIRDAYADGRIFVAPMFSGLGLQNKILEAMAMGLPCVTTTMVNNAIGAELDSEILVSDTLEGLTDHIQRLMVDPEEYNRLSAAARSFVVTNYQWEDQVNKLESFINAKNVYAET
jgi:sugar transferase (PEP-CTERM/EpsH1 system associated)